MLRLYHLFTHTHRLCYGLICFPVTEDSGKTYLQMLSVRSSEVIFTVLLLIPAFTCPDSLKRSKKSYCLRHCLYFLKSTTSKHTLSSIYCKSPRCPVFILLYLDKCLVVFSNGTSSVSIKESCYKVRKCQYSSSFTS